MGHVQRTSRRKNLPKGPAAPAFVQWTVPQACVWIRTYDQAKADSLTPEDAQLMLMPDILAPLRCLRAALERGCFSMWGRPAKLEFGPPGNQLLNDVDEIVPQAFWLDDGEFREHELAFVAHAPERDSRKPLRTAQEGEPQDFARRWVNLYFERDAIIGHWQAPQMALEDGPRELAYLIENRDLHNGPEDDPSWFLGRDEVTVEGFDLSGQFVTINKKALAMLRPVIEGDSLTLGSARWSGVVVSLASPPERAPDSTSHSNEADPDTVLAAELSTLVTEAAPGSTIELRDQPLASPQDDGSRGDPLHRRIREWKATKYPNGTAKGQKQLVRECAEALELKSLHPRTYRRALGGG